MKQWENTEVFWRISKGNEKQLISQSRFEPQAESCEDKHDWLSAVDLNSRGFGNYNCAIQTEVTDGWTDEQTALV